MPFIHFEGLLESQLVFSTRCKSRHRSAIIDSINNNVVVTDLRD